MNFQADNSQILAQLSQMFQNPGMTALMGGVQGGVGAAPAMPHIEFDTAKLMALQKQYLEDAAKLWQQTTQAASQSHNATDRADIAGVVVTDVFEYAGFSKGPSNA